MIDLDAVWAVVRFLGRVALLVAGALLMLALSGTGLMVWGLTRAAGVLP